MRHPSDSRMLREVAADIRAKAAEEKKNGYLRADVQFSCRTRHGLIVRCQGTEEAIEQMVKRYEKASRKRTNGTAVGAFRRKTKCPSTKPAYLTGFNSLVESGDTANALELASLYKFEVYFIHTENGPRLLSSPGLLSDSRFVCGRRETTNQCRWSVTHIDSGLSMGADRFPCV